MQRLLTIILLILTGSLISCDSLLSDYDTKSLPLEVKDYKPLLCVFSNYIHNKGLSLELSSTLSPGGDQRGPEITNAKVTLVVKDGEILFDDIIEFSDTINDYHQAKLSFIDISQLKFQPKPNDILILTIKVDGYEMVTGQTNLPALVEAEELTAYKYIGDAVLYRFVLQFNDPQEFDNYYLVSSVYYLTTWRIPTVSPYDVWSETRRHRVPLSDPVFDFMPNLRSSTLEPYDISAYKPRIFSDKGFNGNSYGLKIEMPLRYISPYDATIRKYESEYELELYSISKDLFEGYKSNYMTKVVEGDIYAEPVILYSNMSNKIGLFGAINGPSRKKARVEQDDWLYFDPNDI